MSSPGWPALFFSDRGWFEKKGQLASAIWTDRERERERERHWHIHVPSFWERKSNKQRQRLCVLQHLSCLFPADWPLEACLLWGHVFWFSKRTHTETQTIGAKDQKSVQYWERSTFPEVPLIEKEERNRASDKWQLDIENWDLWLCRRLCCCCQCHTQSAITFFTDSNYLVPEFCLHCSVSHNVRTCFSDCSFLSSKDVLYTVQICTYNENVRSFLPPALFPFFALEWNAFFGKTFHFFSFNFLSWGSTKRRFCRSSQSL